MQGIKLEKKSLILSVVSFIVSFVIATALLWTPQVILECDVESFEPICVYTPVEVNGLINCTLDKDGNFMVTDKDPNLIINGITSPGRVVMVKFKEPLSQKMELEAFRNEGWGFNISQMTTKTIESGATYAYFVLPNTDYTDIRIDLNEDCKIESIELGNEGLLEINATNRPFWFVGAFGFACLVVVAVYMLDKKTHVAERILNSFELKKKMIGKTIVFLMALGAMSAVVSLVICEVINDIVFKSVKGLYTFGVITAFVFLLLCGVACIWYYRKNMMQNIEKVFVKMTLIIGFAMIISGPFAHLSWDIDSHYRWALDASYLGDTKLTQSDHLIDLSAPDTLIDDTADENYINMALLSFGYNEVIISEENVEVSLAHLPSGIFIALGRLFHLPFIAIYMFGRVANLLIYTLLCYLGMKQLKDGKLILAVIALFPTNLLVATHYSYDYWVTGFSIFAMAYFVGILQNTDKKATTKDALVVSACFGLACLPKLIYFPLLLIPFLMPKMKIEDRKKYYGIVMVLLIALVVLFLLESLVQTTGEGDLRGGSTVSPSGQLAYVFGDIWNYAGILLRFLFGQYLTFANMENYISNFAYLGVGEGSIIFILLLVMAFLFDKEKSYTKENHSNWLVRVYTILMYFGGAALVASALYVAFTPVGHDTILGCQARYIIPWIYPLLSIWSMNRIKPIVSKNVLCWLVVIGCYGLLFYDIATIFLPSVACLG